MTTYCFNHSKKLLTIVGCLLFLTAFAQEDTATKKWHYLGEVYMMFPNMNGETGVRELPTVAVDATVGDILGHLKMGGMFYLEATNDDWTISSDFLYMHLEQDVTPKTIITGGEVSMKQTCWEIAGLKKIQPWFDLGIAARLVNLQAGVDIQTINDLKSASINETWVDPVIVTRFQGNFTEKLFWQFRGDFGGFGIGSDFTWQAQANIGYRFSKLFQTSIGYRDISINYDKGEASNRFVYNVDTFGAVLRLGFNF